MPEQDFLPTDSLILSELYEIISSFENKESFLSFIQKEENKKLFGKYLNFRKRLPENSPVDEHKIKGLLLRDKVLDRFYNSMDEFERAINHIYAKVDVKEGIENLQNEIIKEIGEKIDLGHCKKNKNLEFAYLKAIWAIHKFNHDIGIGGVQYILSDKLSDKIHVLHSRIHLKGDVDKYNLPFYEYDIKFKTKNDNYLEKGNFVSLVFNSYFNYKRSDEAKSYEIPKFYQNLPPNISMYANPEIPAIKEQIDEGEIDYLFCSHGEVLYFCYAWRFLIRNAQADTLNGRLQFSLNIDNKTAQSNFWKYQFWEGDKDHIEIGLIDLADRNGDLTLIKNKIIGEIDNFETKKLNFLQEWKNLGILDKDSNFEGANDSLVALKDYCFHLLDTLDFHGDVLSECAKYPEEDFNLVPYLSQLLKSTINKNKFEKDIILRGIKSLIDNAIKKREPSMKKLEGLFSKFEKDSKKLVTNISKLTPEELIHTFISSLIFINVSNDYYMKKKENSQHLGELRLKNREHPTIGDLLKILHIKSRFPILPYFYMCALDDVEGEKRIMNEFYVFPIFNSTQYKIEFNKFPAKDAGQKTYSNSSVVLGFAILQPIFNNSFYHNSYDENEGTIAALKLTQTFYSHISSQLIEEGFTNLIVKRQEVEASRQSQYNSEAHEIKYLIQKISRYQDTEGKELRPEWVYDQIRYYFNSIFGANDQMMENFKDKAKRKLYFDKNFSFGSTFHELINNSLQISAQIKYIVQNGEHYLQEYKSYVDSEADRLKYIEQNVSNTENDNIDKILKHYENLETLIKVSENENQDHLELVKENYYFFFALIACFRNTLTHSWLHSKIYYFIKDNYIHIVNRKKKLDYYEIELLKDNKEFELAKQYSSKKTGRQKRREMSRSESFTDFRNKLKEEKGQGTSPTLNFYISHYKKLENIDYYFGHLDEYIGLKDIENYIKLLKEKDLTIYYLTKIPIPIKYLENAV